MLNMQLHTEKKANENFGQEKISLKMTISSMNSEMDLAKKEAAD
jgi:chromosome segregation ATPase